MTRRPATFSSPMICGAVVAFIAGCAGYNTIMNMLYAYGATLFDATIFSTAIWRSGLSLTEPDTLGGGSFFVRHISPIQYIPNLLSYISPVNHLTFFALAYAGVNVMLCLVSYHLLLTCVPIRFGALTAAFMAFSMLTSHAVYQSAWEPHIEQVSPVLGILLLYAWQTGAYKWAVVWTVLNASVREDIGCIYAVPIALLTLAHYLELRKSNPELARKRLWWGKTLCEISIACSVLAFLLQTQLFPGYRIINLYFPASDRFGHLNWDMLAHRASVFFGQKPGIWAPLLLLALAAWRFRDLQLLAGAVYALPYFCIFFISHYDPAALMDTYRPFVFVPMLLWPSLVALARPAGQRRTYFILQVAVLIAGQMILYKPALTADVRHRWVRQPLSYNGAFYDAFSPKLERIAARDIVATNGGLAALYPYHFSRRLWIYAPQAREAQVNYIDTLVWFDAIWDSKRAVDALLASGKFPYRYEVEGTRIFVASTRPVPELE